jgi:hypothetical protein
MAYSHETPRDESDVGEPPFIPPGEDPDESEADDSDVDQPPIIPPGEDPDESESD